LRQQGTRPPLIEGEAEVRFSATGVCPSYVTVEAGTTLRWTNDHAAPVTVTLAAAGAPAADHEDAFSGTNRASGGEAVFVAAVAAGETHPWAMERAGTYHFRLDLIPTLLGTVEVQ
jgi:plastocyanin